MAPNGKTNVRWFSYQPPTASEPYPTITVSTGNCPRNYPTIQPYTDHPVLTAGGRLVCPSGVYWQSSDLSRSFGTSLTSLTLSLYTECNADSVVICKGVGSKQHTPLMRQFQGNHVRTNECIQYGLNVAGPGWDGTSTGGQSRDWEWNQWCSRSIKQDQEVVTNIAPWKYMPRSSHKTWSIVLCNLNSINKAYCFF